MRMHLFFLLVFVYFFTTNANALACAIRTSCNVNETCLFSAYQQNNSHVGDCNQYNNLICCDTITSAAVRSSCNSDEGAVISVFAATNAHAAVSTYYDNKVCAKFPGSPANATIKSACESNDTCIASIFSTQNAHIGACGYYDNQICMGKRSDLFLNQSSINQNNTSPVVGDPILFNITVWNIGDAAAANVNVSCYDNGTYFTSSTINSIPPDTSVQTPRYASCVWTSSCNTGHNISTIADPANIIQEINESNNQAWKNLTLTEKLNINITSPSNGSSLYRGNTVNLQSVVNASCAPPSSYTVTWYNASGQINTGDNITWVIPLGDSLLGTQQINATVTRGGYVSNSTNITITILNNKPVLTTPAYNTTPAEIHAGAGIEISCTVTDVEDAAGSLSVNASIKNPSGTWSNVSASRVGNTFSRDYGTTGDTTLGTYTSVCSALDTENDYNESATSTFLVYKNLTITINNNATIYWWNESVFTYGKIARTDGTAVDTSTDPNSNVTIAVDSTTKCTVESNSTGEYNCTYSAPNAIGNYTLNVTARDPLTNKYYSNTTYLQVRGQIGATQVQEATISNVVCYEEPRIIQNPDGSISKSIVRICIWK